MTGRPELAHMSTVWVSSLKFGFKLKERVLPSQPFGRVGIEPWFFKLLSAGVREGHHSSVTTVSSTKNPIAKTTWSQVPSLKKWEEFQSPLQTQPLANYFNSYSLDSMINWHEGTHPLPENVPNWRRKTWEHGRWRDTYLDMHHYPILEREFLSLQAHMCTKLYGLSWCLT